MSVNTNDLLQAIDIVAESRVKKYQYDETIEARIISTSRAKEGIYKVEYENGKFDAFASGESTYYDHEIVYVMIPKGDLTKQKYIIGRKVEENTENTTYSFNFKLPFDNFVGLENLTHGSDIQTKNYLANHPNHGVSTDEVLTNITNNNLIWSWTRQSDEPVIETKLGIAANFKVLLGAYRPRNGIYGLRIDVTGLTLAKEGENSKEKTTSYYFTNTDMYGNTYAFYTPTQQQIIFDISEFCTLNKIVVCFYQDHRFRDQQNVMIPYQSPVDADVNKNLMPANISVFGLQVLLGLTTDECKYDRVFLYTYDDMYYGQDPINNIEEYLEYRNKRIEIQEMNISVQEKDRLLAELVATYSTKPGYEWLLQDRTLKFAWVHLDDGQPYLVNHYAKTNDTDKRSFEYWEMAEHGSAVLHWYHYEYGCEQDDTQLAERQGGVNWKYLTSTTGEGFNEFTVTPDISRAREQWKAIVALNNIPNETEPLIFTNVDGSVETQGELLNEVAFKFLRAEIIDEEGHINIVEDNSLQDFYVYDENNNCIKDIHNVNYADRWYYVQVWLRNNDDGSYLPLTYESTQQGFEVEWQLPTTYSMIETWAVPTQEELANAVLAPTLEGASGEYNNQIIAITRKFKIRHRWDLAYINNTIGAVVKRNTKTYHPQKELHFGQAGSMGSAFTIQLTQLAPEGQYLVKDQQFSIVANVIERGKTAVDSSNGLYRFAWECLSPTCITTSALEDPQTNGRDKCEWEVTSGAYFIGNVITGYLRNNNPPIFKVTVLGAADYPISTTVGFRTINDATYAPMYTTNCPDRVEFKSDGTVPVALMGTFSVVEFKDGEQNTIYPEWNLEQFYHRGNLWDQCQDYLALIPVDAVDTTIVTNTNPQVYYKEVNGQPDFDAGFSAIATNEYTKSNFYVSLEMFINKAYEDTIATITGTEANAVELKTEAQNLRATRLKNLSMAAQKVIAGHTSYKLDPYIRNTTTTTGWYWEDDMKNYYTTLTWTYEDALNNEIICKQAIPFTRNLYSSSLLNSWDGKLTIDEAENAILAQMISAGVKNSNNTFTGVILGDWAAKGDSSLDIPGLYGLKDGGQVFGFRTDGTGFIGKSGRGQIQFDGNHSLISNVDKTLYMNLDPVRYSYDNNGNITFKNYESYSPYFLYAETKKSSTASIIGEEQLEMSTTWATQFINDVGKDYFIVDPNNGVLTTGGVVARYGKIGNWLISSAGLYQKYVGATEQESRYMYLGYPSASLDNLDTLNTEYNVKLTRLKIKKETALRELYNDYLNNQIAFLGKYYKQIYQSDPMHFYNYGWTVQSAYLAAEEILALYTADPTINITTTFENSYSYYVDNDPRARYHTHYNNTGNPTSHGNTTGYAPSQWIRNVLLTSCSCDYSTGRLYGNLNSAGGQYKVSGYTSDTTDSTYNPANSTNEQNTYWGATYSNVGSEGDPTWLWQNKYSEYGATSTVLPRLTTKSLTIEKLRSAITQWKAWYDYQTAAYNKQLDAMLEAGMRVLRELPEYQHYLQQLEEIKNQYIADRDKLINDYDLLMDEIQGAQTKIVDNLIAEDRNKYAIFAGYTPTSTPLFSVNWRGAMTAREGLIGLKTPWLITDYGLTTSNNFGTIFLGNPEAPYDITTWVNYGDNLITKDDDNKTITVRTNETDNNGQLIHRTMYSLKNATDGDNAGPKVYDTYGNFAIAAGNLPIYRASGIIDHYDRLIHFGVRLDGTIFSDRGMIGGWRITNGMLVNYKDDIVATVTHGVASPEGSAEYIALDSTLSQIRLANHQIVLDGKEGIIFVGARGKDETVGTIVLATHRLEGKSGGTASYDNGESYTDTVAGNNATYGSTAVGSDFEPTATAGGTINAVAYTVGYLHQGQSTDTYGGNTFSITEQQGQYSPGIVYSNMRKEKNTNGTITYTGQAITYLYPALSTEDLSYYGSKEGWLGTNSKRWNMYGKRIIAEQMYMGSNYALVATQEWVAVLISAVEAGLKALAKQNSNNITRIDSALGKLMKLIRGQWEPDGEYKPTGATNPDGTPVMEWVPSNKDGFKLSDYLEPTADSGTLNIDVPVTFSTNGGGTGGGTPGGGGSSGSANSLTLNATFNNKASALTITPSVKVTVSGFKDAVKEAFDEWLGGVTPSVTYTDSDTGGTAAVTVKTPSGESVTWNLTITKTLTAHTGDLYTKGSWVNGHYHYTVSNGAPAASQTFYDGYTKQGDKYTDTLYDSAKVSVSISSGS